MSAPFVHEIDDSLSEAAAPHRSYRHPFRMKQRPCWADDLALKTLYAAVLWDGANGGEQHEPFRILRLKIKGGIVLDARDLSANEKPLAWGFVVMPLPAEWRDAVITPSDLEIAATVDFAGKRYGLNQAALDARVAMLPDETKLGLYVGASGRVLSTTILRDEPAGSPCGLASELDKDAPEVRSTKAALAVRGGTAAADLAVPPAAKEALFTADPGALDPKQTDGPIVNPPLLFWRPGDDKNGPLRTFPLRGIPLVIFQVPRGFGSPDEEEAASGELVERERTACFVLVTAPGVIVTSRDEKNVEAKPGSIVWVDLKHDLKPLRRYVAAPGIEPGTLAKAYELLFTPSHKAQFEATNPQTGKKEPRYSWRIPMRYIRTIRDPAQLRALYELAGQCPELPSEPEEPQHADADADADADDGGRW